MRVVATICSREKDSDSEPLSAVERYIGEHIKFAQAEASRLDVPLYILSGKYGLISGDDFIPEYDFVLEKGSDELTSLVSAQSQEAGITEVDFYFKDKESWAPYNQTLRKACCLAGVALRLHKL
jgi:hypothetical protein